MSAPAIVVVRDLPASALDAAAQFYSGVVPLVREKALEHPLVVIDFATADHTHFGWRQAALAQLARELAPVRVNGIVGANGGHEARAQAIAYLSCAPGVTGQLLAVDDNPTEND